MFTDIHATLKGTNSQRSLQTARSASTTKAASFLPSVKILFRIAIILLLSRVRSRCREARDNMPVENGGLKGCIGRSIYKSYLGGLYGASAALWAIQAMVSILHYSVAGV